MQASYFTSLCLSLLIWKMDTLILPPLPDPHKAALRTRNPACKALRASRKCFHFYSQRAAQLKVKMQEESSFSAGCWGKGLPNERSFHACSLDLIFPGHWFEAVSVQNYGGTGAVHFLYFSLLESVWEGRWVLEAEKTSTDCSRVVHRLGLVTCAHLLTSPSLSFFICTRGA